jgi:hypothetical protein
MHREHELRVKRLHEDGIQATGADHLGEFFGARHEERLHDRIDDQAGGHEGEERLLRPAGVSADLRGERENQQIEGQVHRHPAEACHALQQKVGPKRHVADETRPRKGGEDREVAVHAPYPPNAL